MDMMKKIHKIPDRVFFSAVFLIVILINLKYFFLPLQVPFTMITQDFIWKNPFYSQVQAIRFATEKISDFQDEGRIGYVSDVEQNSVFDLPESIKSFYITQYAIVPSILKNDTESDYVIASFVNKKLFPQGFVEKQKINSNMYVLEKEIK